MKTFWIIVLIIVIVVFGVWLFYALNGMNAGSGLSYASPTPTPSSGPIGTSTFDQSISDGTITVHYPSANIGLATNKTQILVHPYIPPCDQNFNYCFYYTGTDYSATNFESAGIRIDARTDLATQSKCLSTLPAGYSGITPATASSSDYAVSVFSPLSDAAAGHFANGALYRLAYAGKCYEFETRIGQSDYLNYPSGTIQQFTAADQATVTSLLQSILGTLTLPNGEAVTFPK